MAKAMAAQCATSLKSFQVDRETSAERQPFVFLVHNGNFFSTSARFACWGFCSTSTPSLRDHSDGSVRRVLAKSNPDTAGSHDNESFGNDTGSPKSFPAGKMNTPSDEQHFPPSPVDEAAPATPDTHDPVRSPSLR